MQLGADTVLRCVGHFNDCHEKFSVVDRITALLPQLKTSLPGAVQLQVLTDRTTVIRASVKDVQFSLLLTIALVVMVIFLLDCRRVVGFRPPRSGLLEPDASEFREGRGNQ